MYELRERVRDIMYDIYVVRGGKVISSLQIMFMGRGGGKLRKKGHITPLFLDRNDLKVECCPESGPLLAPMAMKLGVRRDL